MTEVTYLSEHKPLTPMQQAEYKMALALVKKERLRNKAKGRQLEEKFEEMKILLKALTGREDDRNKSLVNEFRDRDLVDGVGANAIREYLLATEDICSKIETWRDNEFNARFSISIKTIRKYEKRYTRYNKE